MIVKALIAAAVATVAMTAAAFAQDQAAPAMPQTPEAWRAAAESDLEALRTYIREDTPVALDTENRRMQRWFDRGYREARRRTRRVTDYAGYYYALRGYVHGFYDPHLSLNPVSSLPPGRWTGFFAVDRGGRAIVIAGSGEEGAPGEGWRVISCDGRSLQRLHERTIYPFVYNPHLARDRVLAVPRAFVDRGNPFAPPPRRCVFEYEGQRLTRDLQWREMESYGDGESGYRYRFENVTFGSNSGVYHQAWEENVTYLSVSTFDNDAGHQLGELVAWVNANAETVRNSRAIIVDVRSNGGGNSEWGERLARAIWGDAILDAMPDPSPGDAIDWRVSQRNIDYLNEFAPQVIAQFGEDSDPARWIGRARDGIASALANGEPFWREREPGETGPIPQGGGYTTRRRPHDPPPIPARVFIFSDGVCASACLDFADIALHVPGTLLIGADTSADGLLMEVRNQTLPSGLSTLTVPMKVGRGRARGSLEAYRVDIHYDRELWHLMTVAQFAADTALANTAPR